jgi:hypothetical protein
MKKMTLLFAIFLLLNSCEKDYLVPKKEVPEWLRTEISKQEQIIKDSPQLMNSYGAWKRYQWQNEYYFEYWNFLSSSSPILRSQNGDIVPVNPWDTTSDYYKEKCCKHYIWKAPKFSDPGI